MTAASTEATAQGLRPRLHFTPERNWMNDPNGLVFHRGVYHLFFQYNPNGLDHGDISWGHATSDDLLTWTEHPVAIAYDDHEQIFSGSAVVDDHNSSGFGDGVTPPFVAVYTSATADGLQAQSLAYSTDEGRTWEKYDANPVLDRGSANFRDPKVFRYRGDTGDAWIMIAVEAEERRVVIYRSENLRQWDYASSYGPAGAIGGVWECPDLFPLAPDADSNAVKWVMLISLNPGGVSGGSGTQYVVGDFDGRVFTPDREWPLTDRGDASLRDLAWLDWGRDCYAGVTFSGLPDEQRTLIAWMSNWDYARDIPTLPWRGAMTVARRLTLSTVAGVPQLRSSPILPRGTVALPSQPISGLTEPVPVPDVARIDISAEAGGAVEMEMTDGLSSVLVRIDGPNGVLQLDRRRASPAAAGETFPSVQTAPIPAGQRIDVTLVVDSGSVEVFAADGVTCLTDLIFLERSRTARIRSLESVDGMIAITDLQGSRT